MMNRTEVVRLLVQHRTNEIVVTTMMAIREWNAVTNNYDLDFPVTGAMGMAPAVGLGLALARPDRKVWVLNGDGSQLMDMGSVTAIAAAGAQNIVVFVFENGTYETTGGQPLPAAGRVDFAAAARALGIPNAYGFDDLAALEAKLPGILAQDGPTFINLKAAPGEKIKPWAAKMKEQSRKLEQALQ